MKSKFHKTPIIAWILSMVVMVGCAGTPTQTSTGEYIDDTVVTTNVKSELARSDQTSALSIGVETFKGVVQLSGFVDSSSEKKAAMRIAKHVPGVRGVENVIIVKD